MLRISSVLLGLFLLTVAPAFAQQPLPPTATRRVFDISRDGNKIGTDVIDIDTEGDTTTVKFVTQISVTAAFIELYHFDHSAVETWTGGQFVSYKAETNDNGTKYNISAMAAGGKLELTVNGQQIELSQIALPTTLWNKNFVTSTQMIEADKGTLLSVKVKDVGDEVIELNGAQVHAHHYKITGDYSRDVWLVNDIPVRIKLRGSDHSLIVSDLRQN